MLSILAACALIIYLLAAWWQFARAEPGQRQGTSRLGLLGIMVHGLLLALTWRAQGAIAFDFGVALSVVGLGMTGVFLILAQLRPILPLATAIFPIAALTVLIQATSDLLRDGPAGGSVQDWRILLHAALALLAFATLMMAALVAVMLGFQDRALKLKRIAHWLERVPPLTQVEALVFQLTTVGFVLLSAALLTGALFVENLLAQHLAHKTLLSVVAWLVYGGLLLGRWRYGWRGRRAVRWVLLATILLILAFVGSKFVLEVVLGRT